MQWVAVALVLGGLIFVHELGHFVAAKRAGVQVDEFALGFGPLVWGKKVGETLYGLRLLPLGGFVRMAGMYPEDKLPPDERLSATGAVAQPVKPGHGYLDKSVAARMAIIGAGPATNLVVAVVLFIVIYAGLGVPMATLQVSHLEPGMPAVAAGLQPGDRIEAINGRALKGWDDLVQTIQAAPGQPLEVTVEHGDQTKVLDITPKAQQGVGVIGVYPATATHRYPIFSAIWQGLKDTAGVVSAWVVGIVTIFAGHEGDVMGPVGIATTIAQSAEAGLANVLLLAAIISINLGLVNILPIPALDGSRLAFLAWEGLRGRPVDPEKEGFVHFLGFAALILLLLVITYHDVSRLVG